MFVSPIFVSPIFVSPIFVSRALRCCVLACGRGRALCCLRGGLLLGLQPAGLLRVMAVVVTATLTVIPPASHAAMQLNRTRLILLETERKAVIEVQSKDAIPLLLQAWIDTGTDSQGSAPPPLPLIVDPPVARLEPGQSRALQVLLTETPKSLPADRESLFWLNVLEVPLGTDTDVTTRLSMALQSQLKLFYRPRALADASAVHLEPGGRLRFALVREAQQAWLEIHNPAPIHQTLVSLKLSPADGRGGSVELADAPMLAPFATARLALPAGVDAAPARWQLGFSTLDDDGNLMEDAQAL